MKIKLSPIVSVLICFCSIMLSINIIVKAAIWQSSLPYEKPGRYYAIIPFSGILRTKERYVTAGQQELFKKIDNLITPIFIIPFAYIAVKLVKSPEIFKD